MRNIISPRLVGLTILFALLLNGISIFAQEADRSLSPYFFIQREDPSTDRMPLKSSKAEVQIAGVIADVKFTQVYKNEGSNPIEAIYVFPGSTRAAVYGLTMTIGDRTIRAEIREKKKAKQEYEAAKAEGKRASLLEQNRPNVFKMNVANILPGDEIKVELNYTELIVPNEGTYQFVYPTVVGPRYAGQGTENKDGNNGFVASPYLKNASGLESPFDIKVYLSAGMTVQDISSPSHKLNVNYSDLRSAEILLAGSESNPGNRDYVLNYSLSGKQIQSGLLLYEHANENFFLLSVQPPGRIAQASIPTREYIFVVDVSGSMSGFPLDISKKLLRDLITGLKPDDRFNIILFAGTTGILAEESLNANVENVKKALNHLDNIRGGGGTELLPALEKALSLPRSSEDLSRSIVIVSDGYVMIEEEAFELVRKNLNKANVFAFGIGRSVNRHLMEGLANVGGGEAMIVLDENQANEQAEKFRNYIATPVLTQVKTSFEGFEVYDVEPQSIPDVMAERPILIYGKWKGDPKGKIRVSGFTGEGAFNATYAVAESRPNAKNAAIRYFWAREKIRMLDDYNRLEKTDARVKEVTQIGLDYNLMTAYTSFLAIDNVKAVEQNPLAKKAGTGKGLVSVATPLSLPAGVSHSAVGYKPGIEGLVRRIKPVESTSVAMITTVSSPFSGRKKEILSQFLQSQTSFISECTKDCSNRITQGCTVDVEIKVGRNGTVLSVIIKTKDMSEAEKLCLKSLMSEWIIPGLDEDRENIINFQIVLK